MSVQERTDSFRRLDFDGYADQVCLDHRGDKWVIDLIERVWSDGWSWLREMRLWAPQLGWEQLEFDTEDEAYDFAWQQIRVGNVF